MYNFILIPLHILYYDLWFYLTNICLHHPNIYFLHKLHHSKPFALLQYKDTNNASIVENIIQPLGIFIPFFICKPSMLAILISWSIISMRGLIRHDNRFSFLIGNHHILHHKYIMYNFGEYWMDNMCGTLYPDDTEYIYGILYT
jgi:hypothetical protein